MMYELLEIRGVGPDEVQELLAVQDDVAELYAARDELQETQGVGSLAKLRFAVRAQ